MDTLYGIMHWTLFSQTQIFVSVLNFQLSDTNYISSNDGGLQQGNWMYAWDFQFHIALLDKFKMMSLQSKQNFSIYREWKSSFQ